MSPFASEFLGTAVLVMVGNTVAASVLLSRSKGEEAGWLAVCAGWAVAMFAATWVAVSSGAHLNPAVSIALAVSGSFEAARLPAFLSAQILGAMAGALIATLPHLPHWRLTQDPARTLACFCTAPAVRASLANLMAEFAGTFLLVFGVSAVVAHPWVPPEALASDARDAGGIFRSSDAWRADWWHFSTALSMLLGVMMLGIGGSTGGAFNPARDLGPRLVHALLPLRGKGPSDWGYAWIPVVGPVLGAIAGILASKAIGN